MFIVRGTERCRWSFGLSLHGEARKAKGRVFVTVVALAQMIQERRNNLLSYNTAYIIWLLDPGTPKMQRKPKNLTCPQLLRFSDGRWHELNVGIRSDELEAR